MRIETARRKVRETAGDVIAIARRGLDLADCGLTGPDPEAATLGQLALLRDDLDRYLRRFPPAAWR